MAAPCTYQQQALVESCEVSGYLDDVIEYLSEVNHSRKRHPTATGTPLHLPPDPWPKPTGPWQSENVEFTGLIEVPLSLIVNVNIGCLLVQFSSAVICGVGFNDAIAVAVRRIEAANVESGSASGAFKDQWYGAFSVCLVYFFNNNILAIRGLLSGCKPYAKSLIESKPMFCWFHVT
ncbi:hypothetical protein pipiens_000510, partial [Culex pipiens pipiens]